MSNETNSIVEIALAFSDAVKLGYADAYADRRPRTGNQIAQKISARLCIAHERQIKQAYNAGRLQFQMEYNVKLAKENEDERTSKTDPQ